MLRIAVVLGLVAANAFFVVGEYAVLTARRASLIPLAEAGSTRAAAVLRLMDDPVRVISTVQVGITAVGILTGAIGEPLVSDLLGGGLPEWLSFLIAFGVVTYLSVVLGELVPKALTLHSAERLAMLVARPVELIGVGCGRSVWLLQGSARLVLRPFGVGEVMAGETIRSVDELRAIVDEAEGLGVIPAAQEELIYNVFDFASREAADVMVPAADVTWLDTSLSATEALDRLVDDPAPADPGRGWWARPARRDPSFPRRPQGCSRRVLSDRRRTGAAGHDRAGDQGSGRASARAARAPTGDGGRDRRVREGERRRHA